MQTTTALLITYFIYSHCHRPATCHGGWRIKWHNFCDPCRALQGSWSSFLPFLHPTWEAATSQQRSRWDGGRRDVGLYIRHVRRRSEVEACKGRPFPFMKDSDLLSDLHPTETKCQYCWTYLAPPEAQSYSELCLSKNSNARLLVYCAFLMPDLNFSV